MAFRNVKSPPTLIGSFGILRQLHFYGNGPHLLCFYIMPHSLTNTSASIWTIIILRKMTLIKCPSTSGWIVTQAFLNGFRILRNWDTPFPYPLYFSCASYKYRESKSLSLHVLEIALLHPINHFQFSLIACIVTNWDDKYYQSFWECYKIFERTKRLGT